MAQSETIRVGIDTTELEALKDIPTDAGALLHILADAANRGRVLGIEDQNLELRTLIWDGSAETFRELEPRYRPDIRLRLANLSDLARLVDHFHGKTGGTTVVSVTPLGVEAMLTLHNTRNRDRLWVPFYLDPLAEGAAERGGFTPAELIAHLERLEDSIPDAGALASILRFLTVQDVAEVNVEERGAHTRVTQTAKTMVQGSKDGAPVDIPKVIHGNLAIGTRWTYQDVQLRLKVSTGSSRGVRFHVSLLDPDSVATIWMDTAVAELKAAITVPALVVRGESAEGLA